MLAFGLTLLPRASRAANRSPIMDVDPVQAKPPPGPASRVSNWQRRPR